MITAPLTDAQKKGPRWEFYQVTGRLFSCDGTYENFMVKGYSGFKHGKNNPVMQAVHNVGPIPRGFWHIGAAHDNPHTGPVTMDLLPYPGTETFGRDLFRIHGDSKTDPGNASHGCIILPRPIRELIASSGVTLLEVV